MIPAGPAHPAQGLLQLLFRGVTAQGGLAPHQGGGDVVIAEEPGHFLRQVRHFLHVAPPGGHLNHAPLLGGGKADSLKDGVHHVFRHIGAQQGVDFIRLHLQNRGLGHIVQNVDHAVQHLAGPQQLHQLTGPVHGGEGV